MAEVTAIVKGDSDRTESLRESVAGDFAEIKTQVSKLVAMFDTCKAANRLAELELYHAQADLQSLIADSIEED